MATPKKPRELSMRERLFIQAYTDHDSDTWLNGARSAKKSGRNRTSRGARTAGSVILARHNVRSAIEQALELRGAGLEVRMGRLADVITGSAKSYTVTTTRNGGAETVSTVEKEPSARDVLQAVDLAAKLTGHYQQQQIDAPQAQREMDRLYRRIMGAGSSVTPRNAGRDYAERSVARQAHKARDGDSG